MKCAVAALLLLAGPGNAAICGAIEGAAKRDGPVFFLHTSERLTLVWKEDGCEKAATWSQIEPVLRAYDNRPGEHAPLTAIHYRRHKLNSTASLRLDLSFRTPGTRYYSAGATIPECFADAEPIQRRYVGRVAQIVVRAGDRYEDYLGELFGTPFIMAPAVTASRWHQTDQRVGSDCAAFATYGRRRLGRPVPYLGPAGIVAFLKPLIGGRLLAEKNGIYRRSNGDIVAIGKNGIRAGDVVHFGPQVSVFIADRGRRGVFDADDLIVQSWRKTPHVTTLRDSGFFRFPVSLYRWR
jgi:hypothetical protein